MYRYRVLLLCFCAGFQLASCSKTKTTKKAGDWSTAYAISELEGLEQNFYDIWQEDFILNLPTLPQSGRSERVPYSGHWYPFNEGGLDIDVSGDGLSPVEKYDQAFNPVFSAAEFERNNRSPDDKPWWGHCNGFSASSQRHDEPKSDVTLNGITFRPTDIKTLLAGIHMLAGEGRYGGVRCLRERDRLPTIEDRENIFVMHPCEDINPGIFHAGIANWIGKKKHIMVMDTSIDDQVWNFPVFQYMSNLREVEESEAMSMITDGRSSGEYAFNPSAKKFVFADTVVNYRSTTSTGTETVSGDEGNIGGMRLQYIIELDANDKIVGGEWIGESKFNHPDFLWVSYEPIEYEKQNVDYWGGHLGYNYNPSLAPSDVIRLWALSAGHDPENPPLDIMMPTDSIMKEWGKYKNFTLKVGGSAHGASFSGRPVFMEIIRTDEYSGPADFVIDVSGYRLVTGISANQDSTWVVLFPLAGMNDINISMVQGQEVLEEKSVSFHFLF